MEWSCPFALVTPGPDITFNATSGDRFILIPEECRYTVGLRVTADEKPQADGAVLFPGLRGPGHWLLVGWLRPSTDTPAGRTSMISSLESALDAILAADGTLQQTPSGASLRSMTVRQEIFLETPGGYFKKFAFGLIAASPTWT